jgi:hypothetical protein
MKIIQIEIDSYIIKSNRVVVVADTNAQAIMILKYIDPDLDIIMIEYSMDTTAPNGGDLYTIHGEMKGVPGWVLCNKTNSNMGGLKFLHEVDLTKLPNFDKKSYQELEDAEMFCGDFAP